MSFDPTRIRFAASAPIATATGEDEESYYDLPIELDPLDDTGNDDEEASDLVVGEEIDVFGESIGDNEPIELDLGTIIGLDDPQRSAEDDADAGFEVDPAVGLSLPDALTPDDGSEGLDDGSIVVDESKFPSLEHDDGSEGIAAEREIALGNVHDEAKVPLAATPWQTELTRAELEACAALSCTGDTVVAGSSDLLWFRSDSGTPLRLAVEGSALCDLVLLGDVQDIALASTQSGQLFRRARFASQAEQLTRVREQLKAPTGGRARLSFGGALGDANGRVLLWVRDGGLYDVLDSGDRMERIETEGTVLAVARESSTVLLAQGRLRSLLTLGSAGSPDVLVPLSGAALRVAQSERPLLATSGSAIALAESGQAMLTSSNGGKTFQPIAGSSNVTAIAGARLSGSARFFAAVYRETSDESEILLIDPEHAQAVRIARVEAQGEPAASHSLDRGEWGKVACLSWHASSERLWAVGGFGVARVSAKSLT